MEMKTSLEMKFHKPQGQFPLRATFKNPDHTLVPGDFVKVKIFSNTKHKKLIVPQAAVLQDSTGRYVYTWMLRTKLFKPTLQLMVNMISILL